jgi:hypothetical protein
MCASSIDDDKVRDKEKYAKTPDITVQKSRRISKFQVEALQSATV